MSAGALGPTAERIGFTEDELAFAHRMRQLLAAVIPADIQAKAAGDQQFSADDYVTTQRTLNAHGVGVPHWPAEWGGLRWSPAERFLWAEELALAGLPLLPVNTALAGPVIAAFASEELKQRFLPATANADIWWCQGFSEPGAGSDLASVRTRAIREGDQYLVTGQKIWTTQAQFSDWAFCLVRTDAAAKSQLGLSFLLFSMQSPGVLVRPIRLLDGSYEVCEVFLDSVRVPVDQLVGEENRGWEYTKFLLGNERVSSADTGLIRARISRLKKIATDPSTRAHDLLARPSFRDRLTWLEIEATALEMTVLRVLAGQQGGAREPDPVSSVLKLRGSVLQQETTELLMDLLGPEGFAYRETAEVPDGFTRLSAGAVDAMPTYFNWRKATIYGGSNEIQRTIIAKATLHL
jgi:alkylation response protein AidB-like acyl-CoA dehydrogenase